MAEVEATACEKERCREAGPALIQGCAASGGPRPAAQSEPLVLLRLSLPRTGISRRQPAADDDGQLDT